VWFPLSANTSLDTGNFLPYTDLEFFCALFNAVSWLQWVLGTFLISLVNMADGLSSPSSTDSGFVSAATLCLHCGKPATLQNEKGEHLHVQRNRHVRLPPTEPIPCCCYFVAPHIRCLSKRHSRADRQVMLESGKLITGERKKKVAKVLPVPVLKLKVKAGKSRKPKLFSRDASPSSVNAESDQPL